MKLKSIAGAFLALAGFAFCGNTFAADDGDIDEFVPITETVTPANAFGASRTVSFTMRLLPPDYDTKGGDLANHRWEIAYVGGGSTNLPWITSPLQLGVVVSGQTRGADLSFPMPNRQFSDITCTYTTEFGDYAMPLRVAGDAAGTPAGEVSQYYFLNYYDPASGTGLWVIRDADDPSRLLRPKRRQAEPDIARPSGEGDHRSNASYDLLNIGGTGVGYYVKTVDFDRAEAHQAEGCWRKTNEIGECEPLPAQLTVDGLPENPQDLYFYVWSEDESAVTVQAIGVNEQVEPRVFKDKDGKTDRTFNVLRIQILKGQKDYMFGVRCLGADKATNLVMSAKCGYSFQTEGVADPVLITDFQTALVKYSHEPVQTLSAYLGGDSREKTYKCSADYATFVDTLLVSLTQKRSGPTKVRLDFKWKTNGVECTSFPTNFLAISAESTGGFREDNLLPGMEITIPESGTSPLYYIYALGSSKSLAEDGVVITPVALDVPAGEIAVTNSCRILLAGMKPDVVEPFGTKEEPAELIANDDGTGLKFTIRLADSYRNVHKLDTAPGTTDVYTVTFYRGYGASDGVTFTNSDNTAKGKALVPEVDSDDYGVLTLHDRKYASQEGIYSNAWFEVRNPEGLVSPKTYVTVTVPARPTVEAEVLDVEAETDSAGKTFWRLLESDTQKYDVQFALKPNTLAADGTQLWAFLEPANEAASNRTDGAFFAKTGGHGVKLDIFGNTGVGTTKAGDYGFGGLVVQDGTAGEGSLALYNVVLTEGETDAYDATKVFARYEGSMKLRLRLVNHEPEFNQLVLYQDGVTKPLSSQIKNGTEVTAFVGINKGIRVEARAPRSSGWNDVARDLNALTNEQVVVRWLIYEYEGGVREAEPADVRYAFMTNFDGRLEYPEGFSTAGKKMIVANIQDKDMRTEGAVAENDGSSPDWGDWIYYTDPYYYEEGSYATWRNDEGISDWGPDFSFTFEVSDHPNLTVGVEGYAGMQGSDPYFSESQLPPFNESGEADPKMRITLTLGDRPYSDQNAVITVRVDIASASSDIRDIHGGYVTPWSTNVVFNGTRTDAKRNGSFQILDFDGTFRNGQPAPANMARYKVNATILGGAADFYNVVPAYFRVANAKPVLTILSSPPEDNMTQDPAYFVNSEEAMPINNGQEVVIRFSATDIKPDLTNMQVICSLLKGEIKFNGTDRPPKTLTSTADSVDMDALAYTNLFRFAVTGSGTNIVRFVARDKDGELCETAQEIRFFIQPTHDLDLSPALPRKLSTDSDDIADYFLASGIGYGRVWAYANGISLSDITGWKQTWSVSEDVLKMYAYAMGYRASNTGDREQKNPGTEPPYKLPYVDSLGGTAGNAGYASPLQDLDSFFYRWFAKVFNDGSGGQEGSWTAYKPVPQLSFSVTTAVAQTELTLEWPQKTSTSATVYGSMSALAIFSREFLWSDNMGDINGDGVPDSYVMKYQLTGNSYESGADLRDVNYKAGREDGESGQTPQCLDYLPLTELISYSKLIPGITSYDNIKDAVAFTPRKKLRGATELGAGEALNDATAERFPDGVSNQAFVDGAKPETVYMDPDTCPTSTLSKVEWLAWSEFAAAKGYGATNWLDATGNLRWSPERPTDPTKADTDNDGITDGYEYYVWYRAHVGYMDGGIHRYLTGRRYDPRNPGEGTLIRREEIETIFDPLVPTASKTQDTDNDGLPDLLEFLIGTDPFDFDSDGDGLPDGWEVMISGTDPLKTVTSGNLSDAMRNYDGDAMAFTTPKLEEMQLPVPLKIDTLTGFALVKEDGDTDGVQWYVGKTAPTGIGVLKDDQPGTSFTVGGVTYVTHGAVPVVKNVTASIGGLFSTTNFVIAKDLPKEMTWTALATNEAPEGVEVNAGLIALMPTRIPAGTPIDVETNGTAKVAAGTYATLQFTNGVTGVNTAWVYGRQTVSTQTTGDGLANLGGFGMLAVGRYQDAPAGRQIAALPAADENIAYLHYLVYQEFGFDPRTAWNANTPLAKRWGSVDGEGVKVNNYNSSYGYAGVATRTREYTAYDEFLVYSFFLNNGMIETYAEVLDDDAPILAEIWYANTTNPRGPGEPELFTDGASGGEGSAGVKYYGRDSDNGADTDNDGVPDGWELYVMAGPKVSGKYHFAFPYNDGYYSSFGPFEPHAGESSYTDNSATGANDSAGGDGDSLTELQEFAGTDSCAWYSRPQKGNEKAFSTTIVRPKEHGTWMNKFFPTDPWDPDTDKDGIADAQEIKNWGYAGNPAWFNCANFIYGTPVDDGSASIPGGGLNPCSVDTDGDGLPDLWEAQFAGKTPYSGAGVQYAKGIDADGNEGVEGNPRQGLCDGMDGTVADAFSYPIRVTRIVGEDGSVSNDVRQTVSGFLQVVNRDYDHDGLENWQEYMTGLMRCWRYDDPSSRWDYIPDDWYWTSEGAFAPKLEKFGFSSMDEFWTETLANPGGRFYNPHLVSGMNPAKYMTRVRNGWDRAYTDEGSYYWICDRAGYDKDGKPLMLADLWECSPLCYASCSPLDSDSDQDGMDDYYELFHGLNPLLGLSGKEATSGADDGMAEKRGPCDLIYSAYMGSGKTLEAWNASGNGNSWQKDPGLKAKSRSKVAGGYDFIVYPWLNGLQMADPDGDDIRNVNEAIMPKLATETWNHTDPTPLWMTDSSYSNSLVRLFFRMQTRFGEISLSPYGGALDPCFSNTLTGAICYFRDCDGYRPKEGLIKPPRFVAYNPDFWSLAAEGKSNWMYSFEENEGYDTDHDGTGDYEEGQGKYRSATDMQDFDSPRRRQAMYFPGKDAALQTPPLEIAHHPIDDTLKAEPEFLTYTVECWVMPEEAERDQVIIERAIWTDFSKPGDEEFMRKNFQFAIRNGKWYTKFDPNGTLANNAVEIYSTTAVEVGKWAHLAATYDGSTLNFYVNGVAQVAKTGLSLQPEHGESVLAVRTEDGFGYVIGDYWFDRDYGYQAFVIGASVKGRMGIGADGKPAAVNERGYLALDLSRGIGWSAYTEFFRGYVDEISVWDGARSFDDIVGDYNGRVRLDRTAAIENRSGFYKDWSTGKRRVVRGDTLVPELRYHWSFDSLFAAENPKVVAKVPHGFDVNYGAAYLSRPAGYAVDWWRKVVEGDAGTAGYGSVYAGRLDWVAWIPNTVAHLPFYDGTTLDSVLWSENYCGDRAGTYPFPRTAEPVSKWTQMTYNGVTTTLDYQTTGSRHRFVNGIAARTNSTQTVQFEFTNRNLDLCGADLLPLGGAFVKYCPTMWDDLGASSMWEQTQTDADNNGIPDWWDAYADQNYRLAGTDAGTRIDWDEIVDYHGIPMTAGQAYLRDLAKGYYLDAYATMHPLDPEAEDFTEMRQTAKSDGMIPDWWKELMKIDGQEPVADTDNDGLNNYVEYVASELLPFKLSLDPRMARSDTTTLDYFRKVGKLYLGEMLTDHDQMEDHWERSLGDENVASAALWDALKDGEKDGWTNFAENRYNGYAMANLAQLASHAMAEEEVLDAPIPSLKMKVIYNGDRALGSASEGDEKKDENGSAEVPAIVVRACSKNALTGTYALNPDAVWKVEPGKKTAEKSVYLGCWEDRVVRGTMAPGNIDLDSVNLWFAQILQSDLYSWSDENGTYIARPYAEFIAALEKNPNIVQNVQRNNSESGDEFWKHFDNYNNPFGSASVRPVVVARDSLTQKGVIAVFGERVGTIDLTTGDFEFDMGAMARLKGLDGTQETDDKQGRDKWSFKEAIFRLTYTAKVPSTQQEVVNFSLAKPDKGFVRGGLNSIEVFYDLSGEGVWDPGEPFGVVNDVDIGWAGREIEIELTDTSAVTPRVKLWGAGADEGGTAQTPSGDQEEQGGGRATAADSDRGVRVGTATFEDGDDARFEVGKAPAPKSRVRVVRYKVDKFPVYKVGVDAGVVFEKDFEQTSRDFLHEGDFLADGDLDIDWANLYSDVVDWRGAQAAACEVTNVTYLIVYNWDKSEYASDKDTNTQVKANTTLVTRRFEVTRSVPTIPDNVPTVYNQSRPTFSWTIANEDKWASWFGTTYTAFKVRVKDMNDKLVYDSGIRRLPAKDAQGVYTWAAPLYVGETVPGTGVTFSNFTKYTWEVAVYNAKFKTDTLYAMERNDPTGKMVFSEPVTFRMNVTGLDASSSALAVRVCYAGPATKLAGRVRAEAFASPDFTGDPVAAFTLDDASVLSPSETVANARMIGLPAGKYFVRAYIDTNQNGVHDDWESWGYLSERDLASKPGIFNPVALESSVNPSVANVRKVLIEDCDTDGDWFPDVWEAEQNGDQFDRTKIAPVTGNAELIGVNPELKSVLNADAAVTPVVRNMLSALRSPVGVSVMTGIDPADIEETDGGLQVKSEVDPETLTITGFDIDAANKRVLLKVGAETTANVDAAVARFLNVRVQKGAEVTVKVEHAASPAGPWYVLEGVGGTVTVDRAGADIEVNLTGELPAQGFFRAKVEEK